MAKQELEQAIADLGITVDSTFVPWSQSRNKGEKHRSLNWLVTVKVKGRDVLTTDYMAGVGHCSERTLAQRDPYIKRQMETLETEKGQEARYMQSGDWVSSVTGKRLLPDPVDVLYSLALDSDALDYATFEEWADNLGYDADSRSAEAIYRTCLETALKLRSALGDVVLAKLREAAQDY